MNMHFVPSVVSGPWSVVPANGHWSLVIGHLSLPTSHIDFCVFFFALRPVGLENITYFRVFVISFQRFHFFLSSQHTSHLVAAHGS